jgi:predicted DNA-binding helix-hairpin-helix protein
MNTFDKLDYLAEASQYDLACSCGTGKDDRRHRDGHGKWLYPVPLTRGGKGIMFKTLLTNACVNDCRYCPFRSAGNVNRCSLTPEEVVNSFIEINHKKKLIGLFLSSGVVKSPDYTMDQLIAAAAILRKKHQYRGNIHLKLIPGASQAAIDTALHYASAVSLNIEAPGTKHFERLSHTKDFNRDIVEPLKYISNQTAKGAKYSKVKCTTQFIVGASDETDNEIVKYMDGIYNRLKLERIYFSAYQQGLGTPDLPGEQRFELNPGANLTREHRLYQVDYLLRKYKFDANEIGYDAKGHLPLDADPKEIWARRHQEFFPVSLNRGDKEALLRVPALGPITVNRVLKYRKIHHLRFNDLERLNLKGKNKARALPWLCA